MFLTVCTELINFFKINIHRFCYIFFKNKIDLKMFMAFKVQGQPLYRAIPNS